HTPAPLGYSEVLSVKHPVGPPSPEFRQEPEEGAKIPSSARRQDSGDVLPENPAGANSLSQGQKLDCEVAARIVQSEPPAGNAEGLAGGSSHEKVDWLIPSLDPREIAKQRRVRKPVRIDG